MSQDLRDYLLTYLTEHRRELFQRVLDERTYHFTVVTEDVFQLHNTSAVLRSCDVFGIQDLHVVEERLGKKMDREIALGAQKWVDVHRYQSSMECIAHLKERGYQVIATTPHNDYGLLEDFDVTRKSAFFFGTEAEGLSQEVLYAADGSLKIPMFGFTESLNISVAAAIILHDTVTKLRKTSVDWQLSEAERMQIELRWAKNSIKSSEEIIARFLQEKNS